MDEVNKVPIKKVDHFTFYAKRTKRNLDIVYPGTRNLTPGDGGGNRPRIFRPSRKHCILMIMTMRLMAILP